MYIVYSLELWAVKRNELPKKKGPGHSGAGLAGPEPFWVPKG